MNFHFLLAYSWFSNIICHWLILIHLNFHLYLHKISFWPVFLDYLPYFAVVYISTLLVDWVNLITGACDIHGAVSDFTSIFFKIATICIPTREVIIRNDDKVWFDSTLRREIRLYIHLN
jgi:hypothetical protein